MQQFMGGFFSVFFFWLHFSVLFFFFFYVLHLSVFRATISLCKMGFCTVQLLFFFFFEALAKKGHSN